MQARNTSSSVSLSTHIRGKARGWPKWMLRYRTPSKPGGTDKVLGDAWVDEKLWKTEQVVKHLRGRPKDGYLTEAQAYAAAQEVLSLRAPEAISDAQKTFRVACNMFLAGRERKNVAGSTIHEYRRICDRLCELPWRAELTWSERPLSTFEPEDLILLREEMDSRDCKAETLNHWRRILRGVLGANHITAVWEFEKPHVQTEGRLQFYDPAQISALKAEAHDETDRTIYTLATEAGPRMSEILALKVGNVDFEVGKLRFEDGYTRTGGMAGNKSHKVRSVPMSDNVRLALGTFCEGKMKHELVFERAPGTSIPLCGTSLYRRFKSAAKRAGLPEIRFHELRHSFGTRAIRTFHIRAVQQMMGHADLKTTERYLHYEPDAEAGAKLTSLFESDQPAEVIPLRRTS